MAERTSSKLATFAALFLLALVTGVFWGTWFTLTRSIETFSAGEFIHIGQTIITNVAWPMRTLMPACILFMLLSTSLISQKTSVGFYLSVAACLLIIVALLITLLVEVPIDNQIRTWTPQTVPADWTVIRARWQVFHTARTFVALASLSSLIAAAYFQIGKSDASMAVIRR
jgi:uncharacterized membrane protein